MEALHLVLKFKLLASKSFFRIMFNFFFFVTLVILEGHLEIKWFINAFSDMELSKVRIQVNVRDMSKEEHVSKP